MFIRISSQVPCLCGTFAPSSKALLPLHVSRIFFLVASREHMRLLQHNAKQRSPRLCCSCSFLFVAASKKCISTSNKGIAMLLVAFVTRSNALVTSSDVLVTRY